MSDARWKSTFINTVGTTVIKSGSGRLQSVLIGDTGSGSQVTLYDNTAGSGKVLAVINTALAQNTVNMTDIFDIGLTAVTTGQKAAQLTVRYK